MNKNGRVYAEMIPFLLHWYDYNRRILPWREDPTPYHVWVSEIMLQQTRVEAVKGYYDRFLTCLPDIQALAEAEEETLLKLWEGLGYYNRVRNMQKAAKVIAEQYGGRMPGDYEAIRSLPGIGDYTAGAISSIAFGLPFPAVDGNVLRVMSRITCSEEDITKESTKKKLKEDLTSIMPQRSGDFNQSLMELGATVCLPNGKPLCEQCPVMHLCKAFHTGRERELPVKSGTKARRIEKRRVYMIFYEGKVLLHRREKKGLLAGLWEFPNVLLKTESKKPDAKEESGVTDVVNGVDDKGKAERLNGITPEGVGPLPELRENQKVRKTKPAKHIFSHVEWHMEGVWVEVQTEEELAKATGGLMIENQVGETSKEALKEASEGILTEEKPLFLGIGGKTALEDWALATPKELQEKYPIPSAFEAFVNEILKETEGNLPAE